MLKYVSLIRKYFNVSFYLVWDVCQSYSCGPPKSPAVPNEILKSNLQKEFGIALR